MKIPIVFFIPVLFWVVETTRHAVREKRKPFVEEIKIIPEQKTDTLEIIKFKL